MVESDEKSTSMKPVVDTKLLLLGLEPDRWPSFFMEVQYMSAQLNMVTASQAASVVKLEKLSVICAAELGAINHWHEALLE
jgi:hypothetical protein